MANLALVSEWHTANRLTVLAAMAEPGDLLEIDRGVYRQWGLFAGLRYVSGQRKAFVTHFCGRNEKGGIISEPLADVIFGDRVRINNSSDKSHNPSAVTDIVQRATALVGSQEWVYDLTHNNCEHFATFCRYGERLSLKEETPSETSGVGLGAAVAVGVGAAAALAFLLKK